MKPYFSLLNGLAVIAFFASMFAALSYRRQLNDARATIDQLRSELSRSCPIDFSSVKQQILQSTQTFADARVSRIHYNSIRDRYTAEISWRGANASEEIGTAVGFEPDGHGRYTGQLCFAPFASFTSDSDGNRVCCPLTITIKDDVSMVNDIAIENGREPYFHQSWRTKE